MKYQDIQVPDINLKKQFISDWMNGNYTEALAILKNNPQLDSKKFTKEVMNTIGNSLLALEQKYIDDIPNYLEIQLDNYNQAINDFIYRKEWDSSTSYTMGNNVLYQKNIYFCIQDNTNITPVEGAYWVKLGLKGNEGASSLQGIIRYNWIPDATYKLNDIVVYKEWLWYANQTNSNQEPVDGSAYWDKFLEVPRAVIVTSNIEPKEKYDGMIWIKIK